MGEITCLGAKNFVTKAMVAALLGDTPTTITNVPPVGDVDITKEMLTSIGVRVEQPAEGTLIIDPSPLDQPERAALEAKSRWPGGLVPETMNLASVPTPHSGGNRIPILLLGALLHHFAKVSVPLPEKLSKLAGNLWRRVVLRQTCCGHPGEPGC